MDHAEGRGRGGHVEAVHHDSARHGSARAQHARAVAASHRHAAASRHAHAHHHAAWAHRWAPRPYYFRPWYPGYRASWYHGVFVYGPSPWHHHDHVVVVDGDGGGGSGERSAKASEPVRKVDRARSFAIGIRGGSYMGAYQTGDVYGDAGLGLAVRYRPVEALGFEVSWLHHDATWDEGSERQYEPVQASVQLFAAPWTKVNPYALAGVTVASRNVSDQVGPFVVESEKALWGPHAGLGIEFGLGKKASVNFDVRYAGYLNKPEDDLTRPGAFNANMGVNFYF